MKRHIVSALFLTGLVAFSHAGLEKAPAKKAEASRSETSRPSPAKKGSVADRVKAIVVEQLGVDPGQVTLKAALVDDLGADSLDTVELVLAVEEEFDIEIQDAAAEKMVTVGDVVKYVEGQLARKSKK